MRTEVLKVGESGGETRTCRGRRRPRTAEGGTMTGCPRGAPSRQRQSENTAAPIRRAAGSYFRGAEDGGTGTEAHRLRKHRRSAAALRRRLARRRNRGLGPRFTAQSMDTVIPGWFAGVSKRIKTSINRPEGPQMTSLCSALASGCAQSGHVPARLLSDLVLSPAPGRGGTPRSTPWASSRDRTPPGLHLHLCGENLP